MTPVNWKPILRSLKSQRASSLVEVMASLVLLSILMIILVSLWSRLLPGLEKQHQDALNLRRQVQLRKSLEMGFRNILPPWWLPEYVIEEGDNQWTFPWYEGMEDKSFILRQEEDGLNIQIPREETSDSIFFPGIQIEKIELNQESSHGLIVCNLRLNDHELGMLFPLGRITIAGSDEYRNTATGGMP